MCTRIGEQHGAFGAALLLLQQKRQIYAPEIDAGRVSMSEEIGTSDRRTIHRDMRHNFSKTLHAQKKIGLGGEKDGKQRQNSRQKKQTIEVLVWCKVASMHILEKAFKGKGLQENQTQRKSSLRKQPVNFCKDAH